MDLDSMIRQLQSKRDALNEAIVVFERLAQVDGLVKRDGVPAESLERIPKRALRKAIAAGSVQE